jgi:hypothetical protein
MSVIPPRSDEKQLKIRNVVDTGILRRVRISRNSGAAIWRKVNDVGASAKPFDVRR